MLTAIRPAIGPSDIEAARELFLEYAAWLDEDLCFQGFNEELAGLPGDYCPPRGALFLAAARVDDAERIAGCVALRPFDADTAEIKRLYVRPAYRGTGLGAGLAAQVIEAAYAAGYRRLLLDTLEKMGSAVRLYRGLGFSEIAPYYYNPLPGALYFERLIR